MKKLSKGQIDFLTRVAGRAAAKAAEESLRACESCHSWFIPARVTQKYCSQKCAVRVAVRNFRARDKEKTE